MRLWLAADRTGGPLDDLLDAVGSRFPDLRVERLEVTHAADDDNVYFLNRVGRGGDEVQVDTRPGGQLPFLIEESARRVTASSVDAACAAIVAMLERL